MNRNRLSLLSVFLILCAYLSPVLAGELRKLGTNDMEMGQTDGGAQEYVTSPGGSTVTKLDGNDIPWSNEYTRTIRPGDIIIKGGITGIHPSLGTNAVLIGPSGGTIPADMSNNGHLIRTDVSGNTLTIQNMDNTGFSVMRFVDLNGNEHGTIGYGNPGAGSFYGNLMWIDAYNNTPGATTFQTFRIVSSMVDNVGSPSTATRQEFAPDGTIYLLYIPVPGAGPAAREPGKLTVGLDNVTINGDLIVSDNVINPTVKGVLKVNNVNEASASVIIKQPATKTAVSSQPLSLRSNEDANYMAADFSLVGAAGIADRELKIQTSEVGIGNNGVISLQPAGGKVRIGGGTNITKESWGATASVTDGATITHGHVTTPTIVIVTGTVAGEMVSVTAISSTTFTVAIKKHDGTAGTSQTIYWITRT